GEQVEDLIEEGYTFQEALKTCISEHVVPTNQRMYTQLNLFTMLKSYFKLGLRSLSRNKFVTVLKLSGLVLGTTIFLALLLHIYHEKSYDQFHANKDSIYRIVTERPTKQGDISRTAFSGAPWGPALVEEIPEVLNTVRFMKYRLPVSIRPEDQEQFLENGLVWADSSFFSVFSFDLLIGNPRKVLSRPDQVVLTESTAYRYFGSEDPLGKQIIYEDDVVLTVTGVMRDFPSNSHIQADLIGSFSTLGKSFWFNIIDNWGIRYYYTYIQLRDDTSPQVVQSKTQDILDSRIPENTISASLQSLNQIHLGGNRNDELTPNVDKTSIAIAFIIGLLIMMMSIINYINLTSASTLKRTKEVGMIKVMGSNRWLIFLRFVSESFVFCLLAHVLSLILLYTLIPYLNAFLETTLSMPSLWEISLFLLFSIIVLTVLSGTYTALRMSDLKIIPSLKGDIYKGQPKQLFSLRRILLIVQFIACIGLITSSFIITDQMELFFNQDTGFKKENVLAIQLSNTNQEFGRLTELKNRLSGLESVESVALSSHHMGGDQLYSSNYYTSSDSINMGRLHIDYEFLQVYDIEIMAGRGFSLLNAADTSNFIINKQAASLFGFEPFYEAIDQPLSYSAQNDEGRYLKQGRVIGVVNDFNFQSLHHDIRPMVMDIQPPRNHFLSVKLENVNHRSNLEKVEEIWSGIFPEESLNYFFIEDRFISQYKAESQTQLMVKLFGVLSILIAAIGLLGLTYFDTLIRIKEIGIRKILGSSSFQILRLFTKEYLLLIVVGFGLVTPFIVWLMNNWLQNFAYRIDISAFSLIAPLLLMIGFVVVSTSYTILKAAHTNPSKTLRNE
ncbi:MAG: ABC transporter permease, partial [Bacteroidota bacterium]